MIELTIDGRDAGPGYVLIARAANVAGAVPHAISAPLIDARTIALQARQLVDAAAALLEPLIETPELEQAFEHLHDALDTLPKP